MYPVCYSFPSRFFIVFSTAFKIFSYPVHLHRCPESSFLSSSLVYSFPLSRISTALMITPGILFPYKIAAVL